MNPKTRKTVYLVLAVLNGALLAAAQQSVLPPAWGQICATVSYFVAMGMKAFNEKEDAQ